MAGAIARATAVARANRALRAKTEADGGRLFKVGDLVDHRRPTAAMDDRGGWNGRPVVIEVLPGPGTLVC